MKNKRKNVYIYAGPALILLFYSLTLNNRYIDAYNQQKRAERAQNEIANYTLTETASDNIRFNLDMELATFTGDPCQLKDVIHPDTTYLILTIPMTNMAPNTLDLIKKIEAEKGHIPCVKIFVIAYSSTLRDIKVKINALKDIFPVYMTPLDNLVLSADKTTVPALIFTNDGVTAIHTLTFERGSTQYLSEHIRLLSEKYCQQTNTVIENSREK